MSDRGRYRIYLVTGDPTVDPVELGSAVDAAGLGLALVTMHEDHREAHRHLDSRGALGILDGDTGDWIIMPWRRGARAGPPASLHAGASDALRALQKYDEVSGRPGARVLLLEAQTALGALLGLECTGVPEGDGGYDHSGDTCPIHEWAVPSDQPDVTAKFPDPSSPNP